MKYFETIKHIKTESVNSKVVCDHCEKCIDDGERYLALHIAHNTIFDYDKTLECCDNQKCLGGVLSVEYFDNETFLTSELIMNMHVEIFNKPVKAK